MTKILRRIAAGLGIGLGAAVILTGCMAQVPADQLPSYTIYQKKVGAFEQRAFGYIDSSGEREDLKCGKPGAFTRWHCESKDGVLKFDYTTHKSSVYLKDVKVDGSERKMERVDSPQDGVRKTWVPADTLSNG